MDKQRLLGEYLLHYKKKIPLFIMRCLDSDLNQFALQYCYCPLNSLFLSPASKPFIYEPRESSLVPEGFLTAQFLQKLQLYETICFDMVSPFVCLYLPIQNTTCQLVPLEQGGGIYKGADQKNTLKTKDTGQTFTRLNDKLNQIFFLNAILFFKNSINIICKQQ